MSKIKCSIELVGEERNVGKLIEMLTYMDFCGVIGHTCQFKVWFDGDGAGKIDVNVKELSEEAKSEYFNIIDKKYRGKKDPECFYFE